VQLDRVAVKLETKTDRPDHTYHLRSLATQVAGGIHVELASQAIHDLLADESGIAGEKLEALYRVTRGALD
jgi:3-deoxy-D-arabino-heptulosonate 7-phosphate (DAHP) synthase class II